MTGIVEHLRFKVGEHAHDWDYHVMQLPRGIDLIVGMDFMKDNDVSLLCGTLMIRQKDHSANAEHCDTGTPEIRIHVHIPAGTGRSTVTRDLPTAITESSPDLYVHTYMYVCTGTLLSCAQMHGIISPIGHLLTQYRSANYRCIRNSPYSRS